MSTRSSESFDSIDGATELAYGWGATPVGPALLAWDQRGIRSLTLAATDKQISLNHLAKMYPKVQLASSQPQAVDLLEACFAGEYPMPLLLEGTDFQCAVWRALMALSFGEVISYADLAKRLGRPRAARAVGNALAANRIGFLVPCHRVVQATGAIGRFRWGSQTKIDLLAWERESRSSQTLADEHH